MFAKPRIKKKGFTLIELLVVIAIIAILAAILFPVFASAKLSANKTKCIGNMKQLVTALNIYVDNWNGRLPNATHYSRVIYLSYEYKNQKSINWDIQLPFIQDLLASYTKSAGVWMCPSWKLTDNIPLDERSQLVTGKNYQFKYNYGGLAAGRNIPTSYAWAYYRDIAVSPWNTPISGVMVSEMKRPTLVPVFFEMPFWSSNRPSHEYKETDDHGTHMTPAMNVAFYAGNVKFIRTPNNWNTFNYLTRPGWGVPMQ